MPSASETYWNSFQVSDKDVERVYNFMLEKGEQASSAELSRIVIAARAHEEQERRARLNSEAQLYQPKNEYRIGQRLILSAFSDIEASVTQVRPSDNPRLAAFDVITVSLPDGNLLNLASGFSAPHPLNEIKPIATGASDESPDDIYANYGAQIESALTHRLSADKEFVQRDGTWLLSDALSPIDDFGLNIIEAAIEQNNTAMGTLDLARVLKTDAGMQLELEGAKSENTIFSLNYALGRDERFRDVGPQGETRWYLQRLVPSEVLATPRVLQFGRSVPLEEPLPPELETILAEIQDDNDDDAPPEGAPANVNIVLTYPHRRAGSLPYTSGVRAFFPRADKPMLITLVDEYGARIPAWVVPNDNYLYGLKNWYDKNKMNPGALLELAPGPEPFTAELRFQPRREGKSLWVRTAKVENLRLTFGTTPRPVAFKYDEEMLIVAEDQNGLDRLTASSYGDRPLETLLLDIFPELIKLGGGSSIHAKTMYSAVNFAHRVGARAVFTALMRGEAFAFTSGGYFVLQQVTARAA